MAIDVNRTSVFTVKFVQAGAYVLEDFQSPGQWGAEQMWKEKYKDELAQGLVQLVNVFRKQ